ncbi:MAG: YbhB/YbcL family Raf kinase inhibitor-like protein [Alphaproteobacteria bacterium]|nr:YbhB/YbcL family Raf kinase inhibitor-like protein [Alphaproteobacteria bacterium]
MKRFAFALFGVVCAKSALALELSSPDIHDGAALALEQVYTRCGGQNTSPALLWRGAPDATRSFALTMLDLSVKPNGWSHWIVVGLPPGTHALGKGAVLPTGAHAVMSDFGDAAYAGPCPPTGSGVHRYQFTIWALRVPTVKFPAHATATQVAAALQKVSLAKSSITGTFQR